MVRTGPVEICVLALGGTVEYLVQNDEIAGVDVLLQEVQGYPVVIAVNGWKREGSSHETVR